MTRTEFALVLIATLIVFGAFDWQARNRLAEQVEPHSVYIPLDSERVPSLIVEAMHYYLLGPCAEGSPDGWVVDHSEWADLESMLCDPGERAVIMETYLAEWWDIGCVSLPVPWDVLGADFEDILCE